MRKTKLRSLLAAAIALFSVFSAGSVLGSPGDLYVGDIDSIYVLNPNAQGDRIATGFHIARGIEFDRQGNLYVANNVTGDVVKFAPGSTSRTTFTAGLVRPHGLALAANGDLFVSDSTLNTVYRVRQDGTRTVFASDVLGARGMAFDSKGNLFVVATDANSVLKFTSDGTRSVFASSFNKPFGIAITPAGDVFVTDSSQQIYRYRATGTNQVFASGFSNLQSLASDAAGNLFVGDVGSSTIFRFAASNGAKTTFNTGIAPYSLLFEPPTARLLNVSTRLRVLPGDGSAAIAGSIITGTGQRRLMIRALGPSLSQSGISRALPDPTLEVRAGNGLLLFQNDNWQESSQMAEIQASGIAPTQYLESAVIVTLQPPSSFTAIMRDKNTSAAGVGLIEIYDLTPAGFSEIANLSTRGRVETGNEVMIGGFIVGGGNGAARVLVRALGPSLAAAGVPDALADPKLSLRDANGSQIEVNDDWQISQSYLDEIKATGLQPTNDRESTLIATVPAGNYTAIVQGFNNGTGVGLVEIYNLP